MNCSVKLRWITSYSYRDLAKNKGVIHIPYQLSVMTIFEMYRMNIPMFFPSPELLARWQVDYYLMNERSFDGAFFGKRPNSSIIPPHPSQKGIPDPKNEYDYDSILYWVRTADFYQVMPYGVVYDSIPHLVALLKSIDNNRLWQISRSMQNYNIEFKKALLTKWRDILLEFARHSRNNPN